jgi:hypothetical protein
VRLATRAPVRPSVRRPRWPVIALLAVALLSTAAGTWLAVNRLLPDEPGSDANLDGLSVQVGEAGWVAMDAHAMDSQGGFQMPAQMMPGAPEGDDMRLGIPLTLVNTSGEVRRFDLRREFMLVGGLTGDPVRPHSDTFGLLNRLTAGNAVNGVVYFDTKVPTATDPPLRLRWSRDGRSVDIALRWVGAAPPTHTHGP